MRNFATAVFITTLAVATVNTSAQQSAIKADPEATTAASSQARLPSRVDSQSAGESTTRIKMEVPIFARPETVPVATWDGGKLTNTEVSATLSTVRPSTVRVISPEHFARMPREQQVETVKQLAFQRILLQKARAEGIDENTSPIATLLQHEEDAMLNRIYYNEKVIPRIDALAKEQAREYYEENKEELFTRPGIDFIRDLFVSTYEMVTAEEGDTLEGLAASITGDASAAKRIRSGTSPYYLRQPPEEIKDDVLKSPLEAGEVLFVPMNDDAVASATKVAEQLRRKLVSGQDMDEVAETAPQDYMVTATAAIQFLPEVEFYDGLREAADALGETSVSQIVKSPAGLHILVLENSTTTETVPFEQVELQIMQRVSLDPDKRRQTIEETREETLNALWKKYGVKVNEEAIARQTYAGADPLTSETAIATVGDFTYTLDEFLRDLRLTGKDWGQLTRQERYDVLRIAPTLVNHLMARDARDLGLDQREEFQEMRQEIADSEIVAEYRRRQGANEPVRVTDEDLRAYYTDNIDNYTSPAQVTIREIGKRINMNLPPAQKAEAIETAKKSLEEIRSRINSEEDFAQLARRESEAISTRSRGGLIGTVSSDFRGEAFRNQLRQLQPGEVSEPFLYGSEVVIIRLDDRLAPTVHPFEDVKRQVMRDYARTMPDKLKDQRRQKILDEANFKLHF